MPGPRPVPNNVRRLKGQKQRTTPKYVAMPVSAPPAWLDPVGKAEWRRVQGITSHKQLLTVADKAALTAYCAAWSVLVAASKDITKRGILVPARSSADKAKGEGAAVVKNPSIAVMRDSQATLKMWSRELGLTPAARTGLEIPTGGTASYASRLLSLGLVDDEDLD